MARHGRRFTPDKPFSSQDLWTRCIQLNVPVPWDTEISPAKLVDQSQFYTCDVLP